MNSLCVYDYRLPHATPAGGPTTWALGSGVLKGGGSAPGDSQRGGAMRLKGKKKNSVNGQLWNIVIYYTHAHSTYM